MPVLRSLLAREERSRRLPRVDGATSAAGVTVVPERALQIAAVYASVRRLAESGSMLPVGMFRRTASYRERVDQHPSLRLVTDEPNPTMDAAEFYRTMIGWMGVRGNGYAYVERAGNGLPRALWPVMPTSVEIRRAADGTLVYKVTPDSTEHVPLREDNGLVRAENMLHYRAFGLGVEGLSPISMARQQVGINWAASSYLGGFFARDASPGGVITVDKKLSSEAYDRLVEQWTSLHEGFSNAHRLAVLENGAKWESVTLSPEDAAFLEIMKFGRTEIASIFGVPPHMIGDLEHATFSNIEQQSLDFVIYGLAPWLVRLEKVTRRLLGDPDLYVKFNVNGLLRGDITARYAAYAQGRQWGWMSVNDIRRLEDEDPIEHGDEYLQPLNMVPAGTPPIMRARAARALARALEETQPADAVPSWTDRHQDLFRRFFAEQAQEVLAKLTRGKRAASVSLFDSAMWDDLLSSALLSIAEGLAQEMGGQAAAALGGVFTLDRARSWLKMDAARFARNVNESTANALDAALGQDDPLQAVRDMFGQMTDTRAALLADARVNTVGNFASHEGSEQAGAKTKTWNTGPNARPAHQSMNGETVPLHETFSNGGRWPHDYLLDVDDIAGCNCYLTYDL